MQPIDSPKQPAGKGASLTHSGNGTHVKFVDPATFKYTDPSLIPSQPEYYVRHGGINQSVYNGQDPRGGTGRG